MTAFFVQMNGSECLEEKKNDSAQSEYGNHYKCLYEYNANMTKRMSDILKNIILIRMIVWSQYFLYVCCCFFFFLQILFELPKSKASGVVRTFDPKNFWDL